MDIQPSRRLHGTGKTSRAPLPGLWALAVLVALGAPLSATEPRTPPGSGPGAKINNGLATADFPSVALFVTPSGTCTATLIGCQTALTAAHCLCGDAPCTPAPQGFLFFQHAGMYPVTGAAIHPDWAPGAGLGRHDLAVLRLGSPVAGVEPSPLNGGAKPGVGTPALLAGFGTTPTTPAGIKRFGLTRLTPCQDSNPLGLCYLFVAPLGPPGEDSTACPGDSGGPMFIETANDLLLAGVTSGGQGPGSADCTAPVEGVYSDVFTDRAWIQAQAGGDLGQAACGGLPNAGSATAPFASALGDLSASQTTRELTFEVAPGTQALRFTLNGENDADNDFDLFAKRGAPASPASFDCSGESPSALETCVINNPSPGTWHLTARRFSGAGLFQLTATAFRSTAVSGPCVRDADTACLQNGRFEVNITWTNGGGSGSARIMDFGGQRTESAESAFFSFQSPTNFEMGLKVLDACVPLFGNKYWVFISGLTDQGWLVTVRDTRTGAVKTYSNAAGHLSSTFADTAAFGC